jgi:tRNA-dihydrouridine synthase B
MAGITETVFRSICKDRGADIVVSEMVSAEGIFHQAKNTTDLLFFKPSEHPFGIQLFGANPHHLAYAAQYVEENIRPDFIDLNCGCPAPKVTTRNGGSSLLKDAMLFEEIVKSMVRAVTTPITVKIRSGWTLDELIDCTFAKIAQENGAAAIIVHPRTRSMGFSGHSLWERISLVKQQVSIPVIGNGDIIQPSHGLQMFSETGCNSIMIGRAAMGNPWLFMQIKAYMNGTPILQITPKIKLDTALLHLHEYEQVHGKKRASCEMKKHLAWYIAKIPGASGYRNQIFRNSSTETFKEILQAAFNRIF